MPEKEKMCFLLGVVMMEIRKSSDLELTFER